MQPDFLPDPTQLARMMAEVMAPAVVLGAIAGFVSILLGRLTAVAVRIRSLNDISDDDRGRAHLRSDPSTAPQAGEAVKECSTSRYLQRQVRGIAPEIAGFVCAFLRPEHTYGTAILFVLEVASLIATLFRFRQEVRVGLSGPRRERRLPRSGHPMGVDS